MRRFIAVNLVALLCATAARGCIDPIIHNWYLFSAYPIPENQDLFQKRFDDNWRVYIWGKNAAAHATREPAVDEEPLYKQAAVTARKRKDTDMTAYLGMLDQYVKISDDMCERWSYPTPEDLAARRRTLETIATQCGSYHGRLRSQYALLFMRANMLLKRYAENRDYWERTASKLIPTVYREMMENIYANALLHLGQRTRANDIYARQGDWASLRWSVKDFCNLAGVTQIYNGEPDAPTLPYLVQTFVNLYQDTDDYIDVEMRYDSGFNIDPNDSVNAWMVSREDGDAFITLARRAIAERKTTTPCLWKSAIGAILCLRSEYSQAARELAEAERMDGTQRMKDNAHAMRLYAESFSAGDDALLESLQWLAQMQKRYPDGHFNRVEDRMRFISLAPRFKREGRFNLAAAIVGRPDLWTAASPDYMPYSYWSEYYDKFASYQADTIAQYATWLIEGRKNAFEQYVTKYLSKNRSYFDDIIGTKYLAQGDFERALDYLNRVPLSFLGRQGIAPYAAHRRYNVERWYHGQGEKRHWFPSDGNVSLRTNQKIDFCRDVIQMEHQLAIANDQTRPGIAYRLATAYYQAGHEGQCWYLSHYEWSAVDTAPAGEYDFTKRAAELLRTASATSDLRLRAQSLYALCYILAPIDHWCSIEDVSTDMNLYVPGIVPNRESAQYAALDNLTRLLDDHPELQDRYTSKCDVLQEFRKNR